MFVRDAMLDDPVTTTPDEKFLEFLRRVVESRQATAAVLDEQQRLLGLVGIHDVLEHIVPHYVRLDRKLSEVMHDGYFEEHLARSKDLKVSELMTTQIDTVAPDDTLIKAASILVTKKRKTLPVIENGRFVGVLTRRSLLEHVVDQALDPSL